MTALETELLAVLRALFTNKHIHLGDHVYQVRDREGEGWEGPSVTAWGEAVQKGEALLKRYPEPTAVDPAA